MSEQEFRSEIPMFQTINIGTEDHVAYARPGGRVYLDCREMSDNCSIVIAGEPDAAVEAMALHMAGPVHGEADTPELRERLRKQLHLVPGNDSSLG